MLPIIMHRNTPFLVMISLVKRLSLTNPSAANPVFHRDEGDKKDGQPFPQKQISVRDL
jgi:hypothetical protein